MTTTATLEDRLTFDPIAHRYALGDQALVSVTQVLALAGLTPFQASYFTDAVKDTGTLIHQAISLEVEEALDEGSLADEVLGAVEGFRRFVRDSQAEVEHWEQLVADPALGVAGRVDGIVRMPDPQTRFAQRWVIDVKRAWYPCVAIQLAAYADLAAPLYQKPVFLRRAALVLPGDGSYRLERCLDPTDRATWLAAVRVVQWRRAHGLA